MFERDSIVLDQTGGANGPFLSDSPLKGGGRQAGMAAEVRKQIVMSPVKEGKGKGRRVEGQTGERSREAFLTLSLSLSLSL